MCNNPKLSCSKISRSFDNENGFALILTMVMLAVLSILGVMVLNTTSTELSITANNRMTSDAYVAANLATEYAQHQIIDSPGTFSSGTDYDLNNDANIGNLIPFGIDLVANGNVINFYTGSAPSTMMRATSTDAYQNNIYRTSNSMTSGSEGQAAYYRVSVETRSQGQSTARVEKLFVNRGGQVF